MKLFYCWGWFWVKELLLSVGIIVIGHSLLLYLEAFIVVPLVSPDGSYPMILGFIPALPLIWLGWTSVKKVGTTRKPNAASAEGNPGQMVL
jgi:threonine/homoserine/homoserine lactone efflux protein